MPLDLIIITLGEIDPAVDSDTDPVREQLYECMLSRSFRNLGCLPCACVCVSSEAWLTVSNLRSSYTVSLAMLIPYPYQTYLDSRPHTTTVIPYR